MSMLAMSPQTLPCPSPLRAGAALSTGTFAEIRRQMLLDGCKWDPQVGDVATLAPFPLLLRRSVWDQLARWSEQLTAEALAAEREMLQRPKLLDVLGLPRAIRKLLQQTALGDLTPPAVRVMRFDFHPTLSEDGELDWWISEVNSDVPGGFTEASEFSRRVAAACPEAMTAGDPAGAWAEAIQDCVRSNRGGGDAVGLLAAPGYMEDQQVVAYLATRLRAVGVRACVCTPQQIVWRDGRAILRNGSGERPLSAVVRFYQGEWLASQPRRSGWTNYFAGGTTPVANPGLAVLTESKRFPLVWDHLCTPMTAWRALLPETRDPRSAPWRTDDRWLLKTAYCNTGDTVSTRDWCGAKAWRMARLGAWLHPGQWVAQRRASCAPVATPMGRMFPCIGVYTANGHAAGIYGRLSPRPLVDYAAIDVAVLVERE